MKKFLTVTALLISLSLANTAKAHDFIVFSAKTKTSLYIANPTYNTTYPFTSGGITYKMGWFKDPAGTGTLFFGQLGTKLYQTISGTTNYLYAYDVDLNLIYVIRKI